MLKTTAAMDRLGTESAFMVLARANQLAQSGRHVINLGIGQPDFPTPPHIVEAGIKALRDGHHGYTPANGILPLREAVAADLHKRHGVEVDPNPCCGGSRRETHHVFRHADVWRARCRNHVPQPWLSDL